MALYSDIVMDHFMHPRNVGEIENPDGVGQVGNAKCGDIMKMYLKIRDNVIQDVKFETFGCGSAIASSSIATEMIKGRTLEDAPDMYDYARTPNVGPAAGWKPHESIEETQQVLRELFLPHDDNFAMQRKDDGRVIGSIGLHEDQSRPKGLPVRMLGYVMNEKDWGQGFMHEGCMAALEYAFVTATISLMAYGGTPAPTVP